MVGDRCVQAAGETEEKVIERYQDQDGERRVPSFAGQYGTHQCYPPDMQQATEGRSTGGKSC